MANQVLSRPMFQQSAAKSGQLAPTSGLGSMTTPDQNAQALKTMFAPQIPVAPVPQPSPGQGYKRGGEVIDGVAHFADGAEVVAPPSTSQFQRDVDTFFTPTEPTPEQVSSAEARKKEVAGAIGAQQARVAAMAAAREEALKRSPETPPAPSYFGSSDPAKYEEQKKAREADIAETSDWMVALAAAATAALCATLLSTSVLE
jgi:hypothetical protein